MRILALDIETRPALVYTWGLWDVNIGINQIVDPGGMMCFAAKWIGEKKIEFQSDFHNSHEEMVKRAWDLLDEADVIVHYNGKRFDTTHIQREFIEAGLLPPSPFKQIDLLQTVKSKFRFLSNKLAFVAPQLGLEDKVEHEGFILWRKCMNNDPKAWARMKAYNTQDTLLLEQAYNELRPWIKNHPTHLGAFNEEGIEVCRVCTSTRLERRGFAHTATFRYQRVQCQDCGSWGRTGKAIARAAVAGVAD